MRAKNAFTRASAPVLISGSGCCRRPRLLVVTIAGLRSSLAGAGGVSGFAVPLRTIAGPSNGLSVAPPFGFRSASISLADVMAYYAVC